MSDSTDAAAASADMTDARPTLARDSIRPTPSGVATAAGDGNYIYRMNHKKRGLFVIINNKKFNPSTKMGERSGTDADAANIHARFKALDFDVHLFTDKTIQEMLNIMLEAARYNHADSDCFGCAILSHGDEGVVYGIDDTIKVDDLVEPLKGHNCPTLIGKPKFFIIQACRGSQLDHGVEMSDGGAEEPKIYRIPQEADILFAYSTVPGYFSWRNSTRGSWFIQSLCRVLEEYGESRDIHWILIRANHITAYEFESNASKEFMNRKKQVPQIVSMLTKELIFTPKSTAV